MNIACIGWGSLIWDARDLPIKTPWSDDGPLLPIEFARESSDGRITLVLTDSSNNLISLWTLMNVRNITEAKNALAKREGISENNIKYSIGFWDSASNSSHGHSSNIIEAWAKNKSLDGVVWTNLKYGFKSSRGVMPKYRNILSHFNSLPNEKFKVAEEYIRKTPIQINTEYRSRLEVDLRSWVGVQK